MQAKSYWLRMLFSCFQVWTSFVFVFLHWVQFEQTNNYFVSTVQNFRCLYCYFSGKTCLKLLKYYGGIIGEAWRKLSFTLINVYYSTQNAVIETLMRPIICIRALCYSEIQLPSLIPKIANGESILRIYLALCFIGSFNS